VIIANWRHTLALDSCLTDNLPAAQCDSDELPVPMTVSVSYSCVIDFVDIDIQCTGRGACCNAEDPATAAATAATESSRHCNSVQYEQLCSYCV